jgi:uncharacterized protein YukE
VGETFKVNTEQLRASAGVLSDANVERNAPATDANDLGSLRSRGAYGQFERYWQGSFSTVSSSIDALSEALRTTAAAYEQHEAKSAEALVGAARAF